MPGRPSALAALAFAALSGAAAQESDFDAARQAGLSSLRKELPAAIERMSKIRRLPVPHAPLELRLLGGRGLIARLSERSFEDRDRAALRRREAFLARLALGPAEGRLEAAYDRLCHTPGTVSYDFADDVFVVTMLGSEWYEPAFLHEIVHFLEDTHLEARDPPVLLDRELARREGEDDELLALQCLIEGTATVAVVEAMLDSFGLSLADYEALAAREGLEADLSRVVERRAAATPPKVGELAPLGKFLAAALTAPAARGAGFVQALRRDRDWSSLDALVHTELGLPRSTEQILHPEKYLAREIPEEVSLPTLESVVDPQEWTPLGDSTAGEFLLTILTESPDAAAGWGGDRYRVFANPRGEILLVWLVRFDTPEDATEFNHALPEGHPHSLIAGARSVCVVSGPGSLVTQGFLSKVCEAVVR